MALENPAQMQRLTSDAARNAHCGGFWKTVEARRNLAIEEALLNAGRPTAWLGFWESPRPVVVLGRSGRLEEQVHVRAAQQLGAPILRRCSGGGAVVLAPGCLNYCLILPLDQFPELHEVRNGFRVILDAVCRSLKIEGLSVCGGSDLALFDRKVSGNAQRRVRSTLLHHGTLLYNFDAGLAETLLRVPRRQPGYRRGRGHIDFLGNLPLSREELIGRISEGLGRELRAGAELVTLATYPQHIHERRC
jgi:lipoate-protein ligase A